MASDKKVLTCANDPNFAIICTFFHKFAKQLSIGHPNLQLLQEWLESTDEVTSGLKQLHIKLLRKLRKIVHEKAWETALSKFCWTYSAQDAWEIERFGYRKTTLRVKLRVLRELVESQFERNGKFRTVTQLMSADELRSEPIGRDKLGHSYWLAQDPDCNLRVFQEHLDEEIWQVVATNRDELVTLINRLRGNEVVLPSLVVGAIDEDSSSNSCTAAIIKPPPPEERDESQDDEIMNNDKNIKSEHEKIEDKIPNIKIKFDKIVENTDGDWIVNGKNGSEAEKTNKNYVNKNISSNDVNSDVEEEGDEEIDDEEEEEGEEEEEDEDDESEGEEDDIKDDTVKLDNKTHIKNVKDEVKKNNSINSENDRKVKPLIISQSKITVSTKTSPASLVLHSQTEKTINTTQSSSNKKRPLADVENEVKETEEIVVKKARPTLLDTKREKNISKYEKFKDDSEDDDEEEEMEEEEDEDDDADGEEEETDEEEDGEDDDVGDAIEEKVLIVKGEGSGKDCNGSFNDFHNLNDESFVGEAIEEEIFFVIGEGSGFECMVGNSNKDDTQPTATSPPKATFYFGQPGCLKLSPVKKKPTTNLEKEEIIMTNTNAVKDIVIEDTKKTDLSNGDEILSNKELENIIQVKAEETNAQNVCETDFKDTNNDNVDCNLAKEVTEISNIKEESIIYSSEINNVEENKTGHFEEIKNKTSDDRLKEENSKKAISETIFPHSAQSKLLSVTSNQLFDPSNKLASSSVKDLISIPGIVTTSNEISDNQTSSKLIMQDIVLVSPKEKIKKMFNVPKNEFNESDMQKDCVKKCDEKGNGNIKTKNESKLEKIMVQNPVERIIDSTNKETIEIVTKLPEQTEQSVPDLKSNKISASKQQQHSISGKIAIPIESNLIESNKTIVAENLMSITNTPSICEEKKVEASTSILVATKEEPFRTILNETEVKPSTSIFVETKKEMSSSTSGETKKEPSKTLLVETNKEISTIIAIQKKSEQSTIIPVETKDEQFTIIPVETKDELSTIIPVETKDELSTIIKVKTKDELSTIITVETNDKPSTIVSVESKDEQSTNISVEKTNQPASILIETKIEQCKIVSAETKDEQSKIVSAETKDEQSKTVSAETKNEKSTIIQTETKEEQSTIITVETRDKQCTIFPAEKKAERSTKIPVDTKDEQSTIFPVEKKDERSTKIPVDTKDEQSTIFPVETKDEQSTIIPVETKREQSTNISVKTKEEQSTNISVEKKNEPASILIETKIEPSKSFLLETKNEPITSILIETKENPSRSISVDTKKETSTIISVETTDKNKTKILKDELTQRSNKSLQDHEKKVIEDLKNKDETSEQTVHKAVEEITENIANSSIEFKPEEKHEVFHQTTNIFEDTIPREKKIILKSNEIVSNKDKIVEKPSSTKQLSINLETIHSEGDSEQYHLTKKKIMQFNALNQTEKISKSLVDVKSKNSKVIKDFLTNLEENKQEKNLKTIENISKNLLDVEANKMERDNTKINVITDPKSLEMNEISNPKYDIDSNAKLDEIPDKNLQIESQHSSQALKKPTHLPTLVFKPNKKPETLDKFFKFQGIDTESEKSLEIKDIRSGIQISNNKPSSSSSNTLKPDISYSTPNRKRRFSPATAYTNQPLPLIEKSPQISESSETDLNSENIDEEFIEENDNLADDIGGKRARIRLKIVNTDLRKKIEAQRKFGETDTGNSSSGEEERPRKKPSPRKTVKTGPVIEENKNVENLTEKHDIKMPQNSNNLVELKGDRVTTTNLTKVEVENAKSSVAITKTQTEDFGKPAVKLYKYDEKSEQIPIKPIASVSKKMSPNKLSDKIEFLKQAKVKDLEKLCLSTNNADIIVPSSLQIKSNFVPSLQTTTSSVSSLQTTSSSVINYQVPKEVFNSQSKTEPLLIKKRISPKKIEDKIEILKQNIEKTNQTSLEKTLALARAESHEMGRPRKRSSPPKKINEVIKKIISPAIQNPQNLQAIQSVRAMTIKELIPKVLESDEEIPRKRTISEESKDFAKLALNINESKSNQKIIEGNTSTDEERSRKRTICENISPEHMKHQPAEKNSKTDTHNVEIPSENLEFNTKKREAARKISEIIKLKLERNAEEDDRPKKRTITSENIVESSETKRSEKLSKFDNSNIEKPSTSSCQETKVLRHDFSKSQPLEQEQTLPEDLSKRSSRVPLLINKKKSAIVLANSEERGKMKFIQKEIIETNDKKLKLSSIDSSSLPDFSNKIQPQISVDIKQSIPPNLLLGSSSLPIETVDTEPIINAASIAPESEEERPRKRTISNETSPQQELPINESKKEKMDGPFTLKNSSPIEKVRSIGTTEEKIKIVVKTCSVPENQISQIKLNPEIEKESNEFMAKSPFKSNSESIDEPIKKTDLITHQDAQVNVIKKETEPINVTPTVKTRHTRRGGDTEPLLELPMQQAKRRSRQPTPQAAQKIATISKGKKPKKEEEFLDEKLKKEEEIVEKQKKDEDKKLKKEDDASEIKKFKKEVNIIEKSEEIIESAKSEIKSNNFKLELSEEKVDENQVAETKNEKDIQESPVKVTPKTSPLKPTGRQQRRKREIDTSNIIETESDATPMRQSRRIAQLKIREEAERRKLEEIALKKMKEDLKRKKKEEKKELVNDPTVVTESEDSDDKDGDDDSEVDLKKKFDKKKKAGTGTNKRTGWSSGSNEEDDNDDEEDLFKYPPSDHGSPLFRSDHEFSPESEIEDESQVVPLKRARTARKEGDTVYQQTGNAENEIDQSCQKCSKSDHPEWILLCDNCDKGYHCSCLSPVLFIIPEGDWFCPPCQQEQLIVALEKHLKEFDDLILSKKLEEEERIRSLEMEKVEAEKQKQREELEAAEQELLKSNRKQSKSFGKNRRRKATGSSKNSETDDESNDDESSGSSNESETREKRVERRNQLKFKERKNINRKKYRAEGGSSKSTASSSDNSEATASSKSLTDSDDEPIYKLRKRRQANVSYRFNDYDELINRAIKKDETQGEVEVYSDEVGEDEEGAGNLGRGKDISTIIEADKEEKARQKQKDDEEKENKKELVEKDDDSGSDFDPLKGKQRVVGNKKQRQRKKNRKLNCLDVSSEDDGSDEDFRTSSEEDEDEESFSVSSGSDSSLEAYRRRSKKSKKTRKGSRRAARERRKIRDFVVEGSDDESEEVEKPKIKKKRKQNDSDFTESDADEDDEELSEDLDSDELCDDSTDSEQSGWRPSKRKKQKTTGQQKKKISEKTTSSISIGKSPRETIGKEMPKVVAAKKKPKRIEDDDEKQYKASGVIKKSRPKSNDSGSSSSDDAAGRKTRGRRLFYLDDYEDEESSDGGIKPGVKRPDTPPEEREQFIKRQEEIKRMLAETFGKPTSTTTSSTKTSEKTGAGDSLSAVPLSVIRAAKALDVDYLQRKGEIGEHDEEEDDDEAAAAAAFGDDLPDDFNPDDMDEEAIAKMMEEEDFAQHQNQPSKTLPAPGDIIKQYKRINTPPKNPHTQQQLSASVIQDPIMRKRLPMPTFHPLMRPSQPPGSGLSHLPLLQSALTNPVGISQQISPQQLSPGLPMQHHRQQHSALSPNQHKSESSSGKPRGRRKKITPLRDPVEKAAAVAAATTTGTTQPNPSAPIGALPTPSPQNPTLPTNLSGKDVSSGGISALPTSALQPSMPGGNLNVAQPPQLYKPPSNSAHPSVITRMPQMPPRQRFPDQSSRYYPGGVPPPNQILPQHRPPPGSLRHGAMPPMHHQTSHHPLRPSFAGGPPPLRPGGPPLRSAGPHIRHPVGSGPPSRGPSISIGNGVGRHPQQLPPPFSSEQFSVAAAHRLRHSSPSLNPYRPPLYGSPGYPPVPPSQHPVPVGAYPPVPPYGSYYPPSLGPPTHSITPSNSVIVAAAAAVSAAAASTVVVAPPRLGIPTSVVHGPTQSSQHPPSVLSLPPHNRPAKVTTLETYDSKGTPPPLDLHHQPSTIIHPRNVVDEDDEDDGTTTNNPAIARTSGPSEFSGLVSYFSSQHDEF